MIPVIFSGSQYYSVGLSTIQWVSVRSPAVHGPVRPPTGSRWVASASLSKVMRPPTSSRWVASASLSKVMRPPTSSRWVASASLSKVYGPVRPPNAHAGVSPVKTHVKVMGLDKIGPK